MKKSPVAGEVSSETTTYLKKDTYKKILVVHSYHTEYDWVQSITRGIEMVIKSDDYDISYFYLDTKRNQGQEWLKTQSQEAMKVIGHLDPAVVILVDDNAQEYIGRYLAERGDVPIVFCGINDDPKRYGYSVDNATGVVERPHYLETIDLLKRIRKPRLPLRLAVISDSSETSHYALNYMKTQIHPDVETIGWEMPVIFDEWKKTVLDYQDKADAIAIYLYHTVVAAEGDKMSLPPDEVIQWTLQNCRIPVVCFFPFGAKQGFLCGVLNSGVEQGFLAGQLAEAILGGRPPGSLPIIEGKKGQAMINLQTAERLGIAVDPEVVQSADILIELESAVNKK